MNVVTQISELRRLIKQYRNELCNVGFVPTMGYLHEGHISLIEAARKTCDKVVLSIFVNPLQFGPNEDFEKYPRDQKRDLSIAEEAGADIVFMPDVTEMYPEPMKTTVIVSDDISSVLCGKTRPGHFDGVATVVLKLLQIVQPDRIFFGMKDAQQAAVIQKMIQDFNIPVQLVGCPTVREPDGLAKSSRNVYLSPEERAQATVIYEALTMGRKRLEQKQGSVSELVRTMKQHIETAELGQIDYVEVCTYPDLSPIQENTQLKDIKSSVLVAAAVKFGRARLIDNILFEQ